MNVYLENKLKLQNLISTSKENDSIKFILGHISYIWAKSPENSTTHEICLSIIIMFANKEEVGKDVLIKDIEEMLPDLIKIMESEMNIVKDVYDILKPSIDALKELTKQKEH